MNTQRKILISIIILFIVVLVGLFFAYQSFIVGPKADDTQETTTGSIVGTLFPDSGLFGEERGDDIGVDGFIPKLRQISSVPTAGGVVFNVEENTIIRYIERATGHIFETTDTSLEQNRISNTTIPRIQKSMWYPSGDMVILQYLDENETIKSFYGKVSSDVGTLEGWFLSNNITDIDVHEDGDILYVQKIGNGAKGFTSNFDGTESKTVFSSTINDWNIEWLGNSASITTRPSRGINGIVYLLQSSGYEKILSTEGLITRISPDGSKILLSTSNTNETSLFVYDRDSEGAVEIPFRTLAEKCAWADNTTFFCASPYNEINGIVPDDWHKSLLSFSDDIWSYNTETETAKLVYDAGADGKVFDAINLTIDGEQTMLIFTDKNNLTLWALSL
ncbi:hypothetical protein ACFL6I_11600 [candidate division KSB1 bacterium]